MTTARFLLRLFHEKSSYISECVQQIVSQGGPGSVPREKTKDVLEFLDSGELAEVLRELLKRHCKLRAEANEIAEELIGDISVEAVVDEVISCIEHIDVEDIYDRSGNHDLGYVDPGEAAWEMLEESIACIQSDMKRRYEAGMKTAAENICQGVILGLNELESASNIEALELAFGFPADEAARCFSNLLELYPPSQRRAASIRIIRGVEESLDGWFDNLEQVISDVAENKSLGRR